MTTSTTTVAYVPDIERAACQIIADDARLVTHPVLRAYVEALLKDITFKEGFDVSAGNAWAPSAEVVAYAAGEGFSLPADGRWGAQFADDWGADHYGDTPANQMKRDRDIALARLAYAVASYRREGRPGGDQTHAIHGVGGPVALVTSSLAAAVAEYHATLVGDYADESARLRRLLKRAGIDPNAEEE